ncbi:hypothetical protein [Streptomyces similanensis]|uniref:Uncharacterized protein n=1 Tax=Streptomyces similanensis TaxID=1274988 RepID=A0ABP9KG01_9ACTN
MSSPFRHPLASHPAGTILGRRRDGRPIFAIAGGSGEGAPAPAPAAPPAPPAPSVPPTPAPAPANPPAPAPAPAAPPAPAPAQGEPQDVASLPDWAQKIIRDTRAEAADWRTKAQGTAPQPAPAPVPQGEPAAPPAPVGPDPAQRLAVQTAVIAAAPAAGVDITRVIDSQAAMTALAAVNPADANAVKNALVEVLKTHPHLAAQYGPARSGADFGHTTPGERKPANLSDAIAARLAAS